MGQPPTPPRRLSAAELFDKVEVDLWGNQYTLRTITRTVSDTLHEQQVKASELDENESTPSELAAVLIDLIGTLLEPAGESPDAAEMLHSMWESDDLGLDWITAFSEAIQEEAAARRRPTSPTRTRG